MTADVTEEHALRRRLVDEPTFATASAGGEPPPGRLGGIEAVSHRRVQ